METDNPKLSIVVPVFNKWNFTKSCLVDLFKLPSDHQIIVVDNGSSDETEEQLTLVQQTRNNFIYVRNDINLGFAKACNIGFKHSTSMNIMFLNNDIRVKSNWSTWTQPLIEAMEDNVLVGPTGGYVDPANNFQFAYETNDPEKKINYMSGWCISGNRVTWSALWVPRNDMMSRCETPDMMIPQIFSEEFGLAYFEDTDLGFRAKKLKISFKLIEIPVTHFGKVSSGQLNTNALYSKAKQIFINKWNSKK